MWSRTDWPLRGVAWRLFLTCWVVYALHFATNTVREIYPALSLGDHASFDVSEYVGLHPDIFEIPGRGAFINNNPGASILGAIPYALARPAVDRVTAYVTQTRASSGRQPPEYDSIYPMAREFYQRAYAMGLDVKFGLAAGIMQAFLMAPLSALSVVVMFYILHALTRRPRAAAALALLYGFATPVFYRTGQLNQNLLIADFALFAFALLWRPWDATPTPGRPRYGLAGFLCGWLVVLDYSGLVPAAALSLYAWARRRTLPAARRAWDLPLFAAGSSAALAILLVYQWQAFGHPLLPAQHYMPPTQYSVIGYNGVTWPQLDLLWDTVFGLRFGLFVSAPLLLVALYVPAWLDRGPRIIPTRETLLALGLSAALFLFSAANQYGRLQFNSGVRYMLPAVPFLFLLAAGPLLRLPRIPAILLALAATYWSWCLAMYRDVEQGLGVLESLIHVSTEGVRLPWLVTLQHLGFVAGARPYSALLLVLLLAAAALLWGIRPAPRLPAPARQQ